MPRKKKEVLVHLDLETVSEEIRQKQAHKNDKNEKASLGDILKGARDKKKLTLAQISAKLCIKEVYLDALERGHYYVFPGLAYGVGFLRTYAQFLGLDSKEMVEKFHAETSEIKVEPIEMPIPKNANLMPSFKTIFKSLVALLIFYLVWYIYVSVTQPVYVPVTVEEKALSVITDPMEEMQKTPQEPSLTTEFKAPEPVQKNTAEMTDAVADNKTWTEVEEAPLIIDTVVRADKPVVMKKSSFTDKLLHKLMPAKVYGVPKAEGVSLVATEEVWIEVEDGNRVVFQTVLFPSDRYNAPKDSRLFLNTANAGALTVYVNDKKKAPLGPKGEVVEGIALTVENFN